MNCIILGDKYSKGMKSKGCSALIGLTKNKTIFKKQCESLKSIDEDINIAYVYGFDEKNFIKHVQTNLDFKISTIYNKDYEIFNYGYSLLLAEKFLNGFTIIMDGYYIPSKKIILEIKKKISSKIFISTKNKLIKSSSVGCVVNQDSVVSNIGYGLNNSIEDIFLLSPSSSSTIKNIVSSSNIRNFFIFEIINKAIETKEIFRPFYLK
jgi:choline kinase